MAKFTLILFFLISCATSNMHHNRIEKDKVIFKNGVSQSNTWEGSLVFKRVSWYSGLRLKNDVIYWKVDQFSEFAQWFSADEKEFFSSCFPMMVVLFYAGDHKGFSNAMMGAEIEKAGFKEITLNDFSRNISQHPDFNVWKLNRHKIKGYCRSSDKSLRGRYVYVDVPGFKQTFLDL